MNTHDKSLRTEVRNKLTGRTVRGVEFFNDGNIMVILSNGVAIEGKVTIPEDENVLSDEGQRLFAFLDEHRGLIRGLYNDKWWKNGGWNGMTDAIGEAQKMFRFKYNPDKLNNGEFERIYISVFQ